MAGLLIFVGKSLDCIVFSLMATQILPTKISLFAAMRRHRIHPARNTVPCHGIPSEATVTAWPRARAVTLQARRSTAGRRVAGPLWPTAGPERAAEPGNLRHCFILVARKVRDGASVDVKEVQRLIPLPSNRESSGEYGFITPDETATLIKGSWATCTSPPPTHVTDDGSRWDVNPDACQSVVCCQSFASNARRGREHDLGRIGVAIAVIVASLVVLGRRQRLRGRLGVVLDDRLCRRLLDGFRHESRSSS